VAKDTERQIVQHLEQEFSILIQSLKDLVPSVPPEYLLRSAAAVEQTCGGLTSNLWDDPFEWTLPETLSNPDRIVEYLSEVEAVRQRAFSSIQDDRALTKYISHPSGHRLLISILLETLVKASVHKGRALDRINRMVQD
jgi:hypothetical protein